MRLKIAIIVIGSIVILGGYFAIDYGWSMSHPRYRIVPTSEVRWLAGGSFSDYWKDNERRFYSSLTWIGPGGRFQSCDATCTYLPLNDDPLMVLLVMVPNVWPQFGPPAMKLSVTSLTAGSTKYLGQTLVGPQVTGDPPVECNLNPKQALYVQTYGVPQSLMDAMQAAAKNANWTPIDQTAGVVVPRPTIDIDPAPYFP